MHAGLSRQESVCVFALNFESHALDSRFLSWLIVDNLSLEFAAFAPSDVHAQKHLRPILRFSSARAGVNRADGIARVVLTGEQRFAFGGYDLMFEPAEQFPQLVQRRFILFRKFKEHAGVGDFAFEFHLPLDGPLHAAALLQKFLRGFLISPEVRRGRLRFDLFQFRALGRNIKETSRVVRLASLNRRNCF
jgi:hypothetical protein